MNINHIGQLCENIDEAVAEFLKLGYSQVTDIDEQDGVYSVVMENAGVYVEIVAPFSDKTMEARILKTKGAGTYHICYETDNLQREVLNLQIQGFAKLNLGAKSKFYETRKTAMLYHKNLGLTELIER